MPPIESIASSSPDVLAASIELARRHLDETGDPCELAYALWPELILDTFQQDILRSLFDDTIRDLYVKGCTASGKTSSVALGICLYFVVFSDAKVILTSVTADHVKTTLFNEVAAWWKRLVRKPAGAVLQAEGIWDNEGHFLVCVNPKNADAFRGKHAPHTLFVFDEGTGIPDERFDLADTQATKFVAMSNPSTMSGRFRLAFGLCADPDVNETVLAPYGYRRCITIGGQDCFNVKMKRLDKPIGPIGGIDIVGVYYAQGEPIPPDHYELVTPLIPGQLCYDTFKAHCAKPDERWVNTFAHGKFPKDDPEIQVILDGWLDRHVEAYLAGRPDVTGFGLDVAASEHGAETVLASGSNAGCARLICWQQKSTMATVWNVINNARDLGIDLKRGDVPICIDVVGVGAGVADRLEEMGVQVIRFNGGAKPANPVRYVNSRAEGYGELGARLDPSGVHSHTPFALPPDSQLRQDLCAPEKIYDSDGFRYKITPKNRQRGMPDNKPTVEEKLGRSPDRGDAVVNLYRAVALAKRTASEGLSVYDIRTSVRLPGPADEIQLRTWKDNVAAIYQHDQRSPVAMVALGCRPDVQQVGLLLAKTWEHTVPKHKIAADIAGYYQRLHLLGVAFDPSRSFYLADELVILPAAPRVVESPLTTERRKKIGQLLQWYLPEQRISLYQDDRLVNQLIRLPVEGKSDGYVLGDVEAAGGQLEVAVAFAIALYWSHGTMASAKGK